MTIVNPHVCHNLNKQLQIYFGSGIVTHTASQRL